MVASAISLTLALGISSIFVFALTQFRYIVSMNQAQENVLWLAYHTRNVMSQAIDIRTNCAVGGSTGCIINHTMSSHPGIPALVTAGVRNESIVGWFNREWGVTSSQIFSTAIVAIPPVNSQAGMVPMSGMVIFDLYSRFDTATASAPIVPGLEDIWFDGVVRYDIDASSFNTPGNYLSSVNVTITTRYHKTLSAEDMNWCPPDQVGNAGIGCGQTGQYRDLTEEVSVGLRNNFQHWAAGSDAEGIHGKLYYFRYLPPRPN